MKKFAFPLARVLDYRRLRADVEQVRMEQAAAEVRRLADARLGVAREARRQDRDLRSGPARYAAELAALDPYRDYAARRMAALAAQETDARARAEAQRAACLEARRACSVLERLETHARRHWQADLNREIEQTAGESYLARWRSRRSRPASPPPAPLSE